MKVVTIKAPDWVDGSEIKRLVGSFTSKTQKDSGTRKMYEKDAKKLKKDIKGLRDNSKILKY